MAVDDNWSPGICLGCSNYLRLNPKGYCLLCAAVAIFSIQVEGEDTEDAARNLEVADYIKRVRDRPRMN